MLLAILCSRVYLFFFFFNGPATTEIYTLSLHDALPICRTVRLGDYRGRKAVVLYFYPKDDTPGCTKEACSFRDQYQDFQDAGAEVIGVSSDPAASHEKFAAKYHLPFVLLADRSGAVRKQYGVPATFGLLPGRVTFVIDRQGIVRHVFNSQLQATRHVEEAIAALRALAGG